MIQGRGTGQYTPLGVAVFVGLRMLDGFVLQRALLLANPLAGLASKLGLPAPVPPPAGGSPIGILGHGLTPFQTVIWSMSIGAALKQSFHILFVFNQPMYVGGALFICTFNTFCNSLNTMLFTAAGSNPSWSPLMLKIGTAFYAAGMFIETYSELQRKWFKDRPESQGKPYASGLFSVARNINYTGYMLWRAGFATASGGVWGVAVAAWSTYDFCCRCIPILDQYCAKRYGAQWDKVRAKVPYTFLPGIL